MRVVIGLSLLAACAVHSATAIKANSSTQVGTLVASEVKSTIARQADL